jgi:hypothetical protein
MGESTTLLGGGISWRRQRMKMVKRNRRQKMIYREQKFEDKRSLKDGILCIFFKKKEKSERNHYK